MYLWMTFDWLINWVMCTWFIAGMHWVLAQGRGEYGWRSLQDHKFDGGVFTWELHHQGFLAAIHSGDGILYTYWIVCILNSPLIEQNNYWTIHSLNNMHIEQSTYWKSNYRTKHLLNNTLIEQYAYWTMHLSNNTLIEQYSFLQNVVLEFRTLKYSEATWA